MFYIPRQLARGLNETVKRIMYDFFFLSALSISALWLKALTRQSNHCGFSIYIFDNSKSKSMVRLVRAEKMVLSGLVFARKMARMILIQNIKGLMGPLMFNMAFMPLYMWEMWDVTPVTDTRTDRQWKVVQYSVWAESAISFTCSLFLPLYWGEC